MENVRDKEEVSVKTIDEDPELKDAYDIIYAQIEDIIAQGGIDEENIAYILKAVMEAIDAIGQFVEWDGPTKAAKAKELTKHILTDLHKRGKMDDEMYRKLTSALNVLSGAMFALTIFADKGKILFQHVKTGLQRACTRCKNRRNEQLLQDRADRERRKALRGVARQRIQARAASHSKSDCKKM